MLAAPSAARAGPARTLGCGGRSTCGDGDAGAGAAGGGDVAVVGVVAAGEGEAEQEVAGGVGDGRARGGRRGRTASASTSPRNAHCRRPPRHVHVTATVASTTALRRSLTTCTSRASSSPGAHDRRQRIGDHDDRPAGVDDGLPGQLRLPPVVEHRRRDHRRRVGEPGEAEPARRPVLQPAQRLDVVAQDRRPGCAASPCATRRTSGDRRAAPAAAITSTSRPWCSRSASQSSSGQREASTNALGAVGHRLGAELADEAHEPGDEPGQLGQLADLAAVPAEPQVRVGAVELRQVGQRRRRGRPSGGSGRPARTTASPTGRAPTCSTSAAAGRRTAAAASSGRSSSTCGASATGSSWAHHCTIDGWWPSESTASRAWRTASLRIWRA